MLKVEFIMVSGHRKWPKRQRSRHWQRFTRTR